MFVLKKVIKFGIQLTFL